MEKKPSLFSLKEYINEVAQITKEEHNVIRENLIILEKQDNIKNIEHIDTYIQVFNDLCEKYHPVGEHN